MRLMELESLDYNVLMFVSFFNPEFSPQFRIKIFHHNNESHRYGHGVSSCILSSYLHHSKRMACRMERHSFTSSWNFTLHPSFSCFRNPLCMVHCFMEFYHKVIPPSSFFLQIPNLAKSIFCLLFTRDAVCISMTPFLAM